MEFFGRKWISVRFRFLVSFAIYVIFTSSWHVAVGQAPCRTSCGNTSIAYPFGIDPGCGSPEFSSLLQCTDTSVLNLVAESGVYPIQSIDYAKRAIELTDTSMTTCSGGIVQGNNFTLSPGSQLFLSGNAQLLLLNCATNATLVKSSEFSCNTTASVCSAFKTCADYGISDPIKLVTECCQLTQRSNSSIDLSLLK